MKRSPELPEHDIKIILRDFNVQVGREEVYKPTIGKYSLHHSPNENGQCITFFFAVESNLVLRSTFFQHKSRHLTTWKHPNDNNPSHQIDHLLISARHFSDTIDVKTCWRANVASDHYLVVISRKLKLC